MAAEIRTERKFFKVYYDFLYNEVLSGEEKFLFSTLKSFLDFTTDKNGTKGEAFPTLQTLCQITNWGKQKVINVIKSLVEKKVVKKIRRGLNKPNLYIIEDCEEMWAAKSPETVKEVETDDNEKPMTLEDHIAEIKKMGYEVEVRKAEPASASDTTTMPESRKTEPVSASNATTMPKNRVTKEKELESATPTKATAQSSSHTHMNKDTTNESKSQERYSMDFLKQRFEYKALISQYQEKQEDIDIVFNLLYDTVNTQKPTIRINGQDKPAAVVIGRLMKLEFWDIPYAIDKYHEQTGRIKNVKAYLLTILYHAREQSHLDMMNLGHYNGDF